jgi:Skp family chaperone for outer membrane proteins
MARNFASLPAVIGRVALALMLLGLMMVPQGDAQELGVPDSAILVIDPSRLFAQSRFGQRIASEIEAQSIALSEENRRIEAELTAEEKALTDERPDMEPEAFRDKADAFDAKVRNVRREQDAKVAALTKEGETAEWRFLGVARPVLEELMVESGASVLFDTRAVLLSAGAVDVTDEAVRRIDQVIGDGGDLELPSPGPEPGADDTLQPVPQTQD